MDPAALQARLEALGERPPCSEAERQVAVLCAGELRRTGRRPRVQTFWIRRQRSLPRAFYALLGVVGSVVAVSSPEVGLGLIAGALVALLLESAGVPVVALLQVRRATQNVVVPASAEPGERVRLVLTAAADGPRRSALTRLYELPALGRVPSAVALTAVMLIALAACAGARVAGAEGTAIGVVQLVPSIVLLLAAAAFLDDAFAPVERGAAGVAAVVALASALEAEPPRALTVEVLIAGAGEAGAAGMSAYVRAQRRTLAPEEVVVVHLGNGGGPLRYLVSDGELIPNRLHPRLIALASALPDARPARGHGRSGARVARGARWPAIALEGGARPLAAAALRLISAIDRELA